MPQLREELAELVAIPSISALGYPEETRAEILRAHDAVAGLFRGVGVDVSVLELPETAPIVIGEIPAPPGAPTVLLYSHYDVVPVGEEAKWESPPFQATERDGALFGRGTADTKSNIVMHVGALRAWNGRPPVGIKIVIEGQEEVGSALTTYPPSQPELFASDAMVIGDMGSVRPGAPTLTIGLRGMAGVIVSARTLAGPKHSGQFGGASPDALLALIRAIDSLHDDNGDVAVAGLQRVEWDGACYSDEEFRALAESPGRRSVDRHGRARRADLVGPGDHRHRPRRVAGRCSCQCCRPVRPCQDQRALSSFAGPARGQAALDPASRGATAVRDRARNRARRRRAGLLAETSGPAYEAARAALAAAWGSETAYDRDGWLDSAGERSLEAVPDAEILMFGTTDGFANIHAPNERVLLDEFEKAVVAEAEFFGEYAAREEQGAHERRDRERGRRRPGSWSACSVRSSAAATGCRTRRSCSSSSASA